MGTEGFEHREDDLTGGRIDCQSFNEVKPSVWVSVILLIESVQIHDAQQLFAADRSFIEILDVGSDGVVPVGDIEFELLLVDTGSTEGVDILHHQVPCTPSFLIGCVGTGLDHLKSQSIGCTQFVATIGRELTDLIDFTVIGVFVSDRKHFVLIEGTLEGDVTQGTVQRIFAAGKQTCRFDLLEVHSSFHAVESFEGSTGHLQITESGGTDG